MALEAALEALGFKAAKSSTPPQWAAINAAQAAEQPARDVLSKRMVSADQTLGHEPEPSDESKWRSMVHGDSGEPALGGAIEALSTPVGSVDKSKWIPDSGNGIQPPEPKQESFFQKYIQAPAETALTMATGAVAQPIAAAAGIIKGFTGGKYGTSQGALEAQAHAAEVQDSLTFQPRTEAGKDYLSTLGSFSDATKLSGLGPVHAMTLAGMASMPLATKWIPTGETKPGAWTPAPEVTAANQRTFGSVGSQGASLQAQAEALAANGSPETQQAVAKLGDKVTPQALTTIERHVDADSLPVRIPLMSGQATGDPTLISNQFNSKGRLPAIANRLKEQNSALIENTNAIREHAAPNVFAQTPAQLGETLIQAYKDKDAALNANIGSLYQKLEDANGGQFPIDSKAFATAAEDALHKNLKFEFVPAGLDRQLQSFKAGAPMNFEQFEAMRTNLANIMRSGADGNAKAAAGIIRETLENLPLPPEAAGLKPIADAARAAARARFDLLKNDSAYRAVVVGKASADRFIDRYVVGADTQALRTLKTNLSHDPLAGEALAYGAINKLKDAARIVNDGGVFNQNGFNKALSQWQDRLNVVVPPEQLQELQKLGRVAQYVKGQDAGTYFNNSNTWIAAMADAAKSTAEHTANVAAKGVPIGTWARQAGGYIASGRELKKITEPAAGLRLKDIAK